MVVTQRGEGGKYQLLSVQATDRSGFTRPVDIPTPSWGQHPAGERDAPYAVCDVWAEHPDYAMLLVEGYKSLTGWTPFRRWNWPPQRGGVQPDPKPDLGDPRAEPVRGAMPHPRDACCAQYDYRTPGPAG